MGRLFALAATVLVLASLLWLLRPDRGDDGAAVDGPRERRLYGMEVFPGVGTPLSQTDRYGATFVAAQGGRAPALLAGYVNYTPIFFGPGSVCTVTGGRWILFQSGRLLCGAFEGGTVRWNPSAKIAVASVSLRSRVGPGLRERSGRLEAALNHLPFPPTPPRIGGRLTFGPNPEWGGFEQP